jgi:hypothetical protein
MCYIASDRKYIFTQSAINKLRDYQATIENNFQFGSNSTALEKQIIGKSIGTINYTSIFYLYNISQAKLLDMQRQLAY